MNVGVIYEMKLEYRFTGVYLYSFAFVVFDW